MHARLRFSSALLGATCAAIGSRAALAQPEAPEAARAEPTESADSADGAAEEPPDACPPGGWYCEDDAEPAGEADGTPASPEAGADEPPAIVVARGEHAPAPARRRRPPRWGIHARVQGVVLGGGGDGGGDGPHPDAGMAGFGASFRYRALPELALDAGLDFFRGVDFDGWARAETAATGSLVLYANPRDPAQIYLIGGLGFSGAVVDKPALQWDPADGERGDTQYSYFGGHLGMGLELRLSRRTGFTVDLLGFLRSRTDVEGAGDYEYVDSVTGRRTNSSGAGLVRFGLLFSW
ncbi:MAG: hypothetical protein IT376_15000 [Polyangiaceae bacterium]|nr:hypothetical protein [Polyangiaceae bacterium]